MFQEHEEVIVFTRDEFSRTYTSMREQIDYINNTDLFLNRGEEWKLMGYWPKILGKIYLSGQKYGFNIEKRTITMLS